jgi:anaerobic dimethyl sulfoxide reductase subunit A
MPSPDRETLIRNWRHCHNFVLFFADFEKWLEAHPGEAGDVPRQEILWEYDDLFKGTSAHIYVPLWASAVKDRGDIILDATTLEVIQTYHAWGYRPVPMDGNPPDFIGQQFRFFCYLSAAALYEVSPGQQGGEPAAIPCVYEKAMAEFTAAYMGDTIRAVAAGIRAAAQHPLFFTAAAELENWTGGIPAKLLIDFPVITENMCCYEIYRNGRLPSVSDEPEQIINTTCTNNCGGRCVLKARVQEGCILDMATDDGMGDPALLACVRGRAYRETYMSGRRLRYPMKRVGERGEGRFRRISWEEALETSLGEWTRIRDCYGPGARYVNYARGIVASIRPDALTARLLNLDGGHLGWYNTYSSACIAYTMPYIYGDGVTGNTFDDMLNTTLLILWGHNPVETIFGTQRNYYMNKLKEMGVPVVIIDPRQSDTVIAHAGEWIGIRPSTDAALANALAFVIWSEGLQDQRFMDTYCLGFDEDHIPEGFPPHESYHAWLFGQTDGIPKTPEWAEEITGVPAETIRRLARTYALAKPACLLQGNGPQRTACGEQTVRAITALTALTGNIGKKGGSAGGTGGRAPFPYQMGYPIPKSPYPGIIPSFQWTLAVEQGTAMTPEADGLAGVKKLDTNIKLIFNFAGNTLINQHSYINNTIRILKDPAKCEFILASDVLMTPSARFADILLPGASSLEQENISQPWGGGNYLLYNARLIEPVFGSRFEYAFLEEMARGLGLREAWSEGRAGLGDWLAWIYGNFRRELPELPEFGEFKKRGGYSFKNPRTLIAYEDQIRDPAAYPFKTPSGKIEIFSPRLYNLNRRHEVPGIPSYVPPPEGPQDPLRKKYPLQLIGYHTKRRTHSTHDSNHWLEEVDPQRLWIHPVDAENRGIKDGETADVFNDRGRIRIPVFVTTRIIRGVVALSQGAWYTPDEEGTDRRGCINVLTSVRPTPLARGNPQHTNLVEVLKTL